jgi:transcriptional regulator with XRE-family HTH domain
VTHKPHNDDILKETYRLLDRARDERRAEVSRLGQGSDGTLSRQQISEEAGVSFSWLNKFAQRSIPEPSVVKVMRVHSVLLEHFHDDDDHPAAA